MKDEEEQQSFAATVGAIVNTQEGCVREDCKGKCQQPFVCIPLWETYVCEYVFFLQAFSNEEML